MPASELIERVAQLIEENAARVPEPTRSEIIALERRLREPLRVAVTGRVKAGKSTLVNALLGQRVAPTDISECTRVVTWFKYGHPERLVINLRGGGEHVSQLASGGVLPRELDVPVEQVASVHAYLANTTLRSMTLIDTPGLGSVHDEYSRATRELIATDSTGAAATADAIVFLMGGAMMADELETLQLFKGGDGDGESSAANAVGVLSRADQLGDGTRDSWEVAVELAGRYAGTFRNEVATVVPVAGLVAEAAEAALLTERDVRELSRLAKLEPKVLSRMLWSADRFSSTDAPVPPETRERQLELLDRNGIGAATRALSDGVSGAVSLRQALASTSGIAEVKQTIASHFHEQDHVLKVRSALDILRRISYRGVGDGARDPGLERLRGEVEKLADDPVMHPIAELEIAHDCNVGRLELPDQMLEEMRRLFAPGSPRARLGAASNDAQVLRAAAIDGMKRWRVFKVTGATPPQARACDVVMRSFQLLLPAAS
jgi:hypothetical protein